MTIQGKYGGVGWSLLLIIARTILSQNGKSRSKQLLRSTRLRDTRHLYVVDVGGVRRPPRLFVGCVFDAHHEPPLNQSGTSALHEPHLLLYGGRHHYDGVTTYVFHTEEQTVPRVYLQ